MVFCACAQLQPRPEEVEKAARILERIAQRNPDLKSFKAVGGYKTETPNLRLSGRLVWAASTPDRFRIEALGPGGRPVATIAHDCDWLYLVDKQNGRSYKKQPQRIRLGQVMPVAIAPAEIYAFLGGRIPVRNHRKLSIEERPDQVDVVTLTSVWGNTVQKIFVAPQSDRIDKIEMFSPRGELEYTVDIGKLRRMSGFMLPEYLIFKGDDNSQLRIEIQRLLPNLKLNDALFILE